MDESIVETLRFLAESSESALDSQWLSRAADDIETLQTEIEKLRRQIKDLSEGT